MVEVFSLYFIDLIVDKALPQLFNLAEFDNLING